MNKLGEKIKSLRISRNLKQDDLACILGLSRGQISNLEHNRRSLSLKQLQSLCKYFKVDMEYFGVSSTAEESIVILERAKLLFESDKVNKDTKDELYLALMQVYLESKQGLSL